MKMRSTFLACGLAVFAAAPVAARGGDDANTPPKTRSHVPADAVRVPLRIVNGRPVIDARINDAGPYGFVFDTGSPVVFLHGDMARELELAIEGTSMVGAPGGPQTMPVKEHTIDRIRIGPATFQRLPGMSHEDAMMRNALGAERGVIGLPTFADCLVTIDYPAGQLVIARGSLTEGDGSMPYRLDQYDMPTITLDVAGIEIDCHIDSGSMGGITLPARLEEELPLRTPPFVVGRGRTASGAFEIRRATLDGVAAIGPHRLSDPELHFNDMFPHANLGGVVLSQFAVTIDQRAKRIRFSPGVATQEPVRMSGRRPTYGVMLAMGPTGPVPVRGVVPGGIAERAGLRADDVIVAVNGTPVDELDMTARGAAFRAASIRLTVDRGGETHTIEMSHDMK
ncbi:MAG: PDZ domain-containing protein [Phycisphaerales bacterium]|nr:aspartyl protease family protein [Phycisphaerae bacterium]NNF43646.1 PDZ domain-containing protein [Phycisphaerales bacterium]NNM25047.1 PDZ domain-containing protein [Phycisphaerales bacterium]